MNTTSKEPPGLDDGCQSAQKKTMDLCPVSMGVASLFMLVIADMAVFAAGGCVWEMASLCGLFDTDEVSLFFTFFTSFTKKQKSE